MNATRTWPSKRRPDGFCGGIFPHVYGMHVPPDAPDLLCIFCGTPEAVGVAAGDRGRRIDDEPKKRTIGGR